MDRDQNRTSVKRCGDCGFPAYEKHTCPGLRSPASQKAIDEWFAELRRSTFRSLTHAHCDKCDRPLVVLPIATNSAYEWKLHHYLGNCEREAGERGLLPCPFCGGEPIYETTVTERSIHCKRCSAKIVRDVTAVLPEHVWNSRKADEPTASELVTVGCHDCNRPYSEPGFPDFIIPFWAWKQITPTEDDGGLLCPSCIVARLEIAGIKCEGAFMSGPIQSVSETTMENLRRVENIELAIDGRNNRWKGIREIVADQSRADSPADEPKADASEGLHYHIGNEKCDKCPDVVRMASRESMLDKFPKAEPTPSLSQDDAKDGIHMGCRRKWSEHHKLDDTDRLWCPPSTENAYTLVNKAKPELQLLIIDLGDSCVVKVESGILDWTLTDVVRRDSLPIVTDFPFDIVQANLDAMAGDKPVPRIERTRPGSVTDYDLHLSADDRRPIRSYSLFRSELAALSELAGKPLPIWTPRKGEWKRVQSFDLHDGNPVRNDEGGNIWRYTLTKGD